MRGFVKALSTDSRIWGHVFVSLDCDIQADMRGKRSGVGKCFVCLSSGWTLSMHRRSRLFDRIP